MEINQNIKQKLKNLTCKSGVYVMLNKDLMVIYVGKAKNLKNRVSQYFNNSEKQNKVAAMVENIFDFEYYVTLNERDAFALENNLIKKYKPFYNILLKDDKTYPFIKINTKLDFPTIEVVRKIQNDKCKYFGPYISSINPYQLIKAISLAYPIRSCKIAITKTPKKPCLYYSLGMCSAPCAHLINKGDYAKTITKATAFLKGQSSDIEEILTNKMNSFAQAENFEQALVIRDSLKMIAQLKQRVVADLPITKTIDVFAYHSDGVNGVMSTLNIRYGKILGIVNQAVVDASLDENLTMESFIIQYYEKNLVPNLVLTSTQINTAVFESVGVKGECPQKAVKKRLVETALLNAKEYLKKQIQNSEKEYKRTIGALVNLKEKLGLTKIPNKIECYDISHISGTNQVASMVVFENGKPARKKYRKFKIKGLDHPDDFESLRQTLKRRISHIGSEDESFGVLPDLMVIDGGKGQLSSVMQILEEQKIVIDIISLAKREEEVFKPKNSVPIILRKGSSELKIIQNIRDEAHRFAITFHRALRGKHQVKSVLDEIKGLGKQKINNLLAVFESVEGIKNANIEELNLVKGIDICLAQKIHQTLNSSEK